jgi:hypothetical protein
MKAIAVILLIFLFATVSYAQGPPKLEKAQQAVKIWVFKKVLNDTTHYSSKRFGELKEIKSYPDEALSIEKQILNTKFEFFSDSLTEEELKEFKTKNELVEKLHKELEAFTETISGYEIEHDFVARNAWGEVVYFECKFLLDPDFNIQKSTIKEKMVVKDKNG